MARIELIDLAHAYKPNPSAPGDYALRPMTKTWDDGGAYALLGPSGCGKTTLLNIISGLVKPSHGRVLFDGKDVTLLPTEARNIAQVFQFPVIYDTMTVYDNLAFPLRNRGWKEAATRKRVEQVAQMLELAGDLKHRASGLSVDAKQKISLGRGLVRPDVAAVLFDEPLTVIDPHLKWLLRRKLKEIHHELKLSLIYVTHDQVEALTFADQVVVMTQGEVVQTGSAQALFEEPEHTFVAYFIGNPGMNLLDCKVKDGLALVAGHGLPLSDIAKAALSHAQGKVTLGIRPEFVECVTAQQADALPATVSLVRNMGTHFLAEFTLGSHAIAAKLRQFDAAPGQQVWLRFPQQRTLFYVNEKRVA
ncbi:ABC transporter ATP-binding protein [Janthinobacterium agaricidamnosum]|uniref:ABC transporter family protein n=1 Tax=Janthinobacterium agaricidamnosum NBRC 102515 = DSM 9628 TaxID=1349767 RepID=W0V428_9BURK|nr:ABC transporter ATP-binding protein [Janthinobacterium agaricidamnosum]CDG83579.1 ABC transporter family protein [Janthinobacterium agaricidamnosum NBRC 102515 = DSM 9628]